MKIELFAAVLDAKERVRKTVMDKLAYVVFREGFPYGKILKNLASVAGHE